MILSTNTELGEFDVIERSAHVAHVWAEIKHTLPRYWELFVSKERNERQEVRLAAHFGASYNAPSDAMIVAESFAEAVRHYEDTSKTYRDFFDPEAMAEFGDDPNSFKTYLSRDVPVIAGGLRQRSPELKEWQQLFWAASSKELLEVFCNVLDFRDDWVEIQPESTYVMHKEPSEFGLDPLDKDTSMMLERVVGRGIKGIILYHLNARVFPRRARPGIYALYFLSGKKDFGLASRTSEFLMIDDKNPVSNGSFIMEHNYYYSFGLYSLYALKLFRWLDKQVQGLGGALDPKVRYVYIAHFLDSVLAEHADDIKLMRAHDRFGIPA